MWWWAVDILLTRDARGFKNEIHALIDADLDAPGGFNEEIVLRANNHRLPAGGARKFAADIRSALMSQGTPDKAHRVVNTYPDRTFSGFGIFFVWVVLPGFLRSRFLAAVLLRDCD